MQNLTTQLKLLGMSATVNCALDDSFSAIAILMQYFFLFLLFLCLKKYGEVVRVFLLGSIQIFALVLLGSRLCLLGCLALALLRSSIT